MKLKKALKTTGNILSNILFGVLLLMLIFVIVLKISGDDANIFGYQLKTVLSGSMDPTFETGSVITLKTGGDMTRFQEDDVITYYMEDDVLVTHRIIEVKNGGKQYITKGDANDGADLTPVLQENIVGMYTGLTVPYVGYLFTFANTNEGAALLLIIPGIFFLGYSIIIIRRTVKQVKLLIDKKNLELEK